jgi:phage terminase large subunit
MQKFKFTDVANFQAKQLEAWYTLFKPECKYLLYGGAASGGKSYFLRWASLGLGMYYSKKYNIDNITLGLFSADYPTLKDRQVLKMKNEIPDYLGEIKESRDEGYAFIGAKEYGSYVVLLRNLDDPSKYKSAEFAAVLVEELTENIETTFDDLRFRLRFKDIPEVKFVGATNPGGIGHGWVKRKWVTPDMSYPDKEQDRFFYVPARYKDNKYTTDEYIKQLNALPEDKRRAYMEGDWNIFAGQYFQEWRDDLHICEWFYPTKEYILVGGMDWGRTAPFSFHLAEVSRQTVSGINFYRVKVFYEAYGIDKTPEEWSKRITDDLSLLNLKLKDITFVKGDPAMWTKGQDNSISIRDQFIKANPDWTILQKGSNDRVGGWENFHHWLSVSADRLPYYQATKNCSNLIRTLPELVHDKNLVEDVDTKSEDHAGDDQRYMLKGLKWIDATAGGVIHKTVTKQNITADFVGDKQISIDLDSFAGQPTVNDSGVGAIFHK